MGKHSKNNNDRAFFSYHERKAASYGRLSSGLLGGHNTADGNHVSFGWGSESRTLDGDAMKEIDACSLSLQPCVEPVVTPSGILYDKQVVVEYILSRKKELERELRAWESQEAGQKAEAASEAQQAQQARIDEFVAQQEGLSQGDLSSRAGGKSVATASTMGRSLLSADTGKHAADTSFWVPQLTPEARVQLTKPDTTVRCPITAQPLRLKQLTAVKFTRVDDDKDLRGQVAKERYMCPLSKRPLSNVHPAAVLRPSGMVVSTQCVKDCIKKDMIDPFTEPPTKMKEKDIITLRVEGTGFASKTDEKALVVKSEARPVGHF